MPDGSVALPRADTFACLQMADAVFEENVELHMPAFDLAQERGIDVMQHAWLEYVGAAYAKFLISDDMDTSEDKDLFYARVGQSSRGRACTSPAEV